MTSEEQIEMFPKPKTDDLKHPLFDGCCRALLGKFRAYNNTNPQLYNLMEKFALEAHRANRKRFSIWMIANRVRWYTQIETTGQEFKVSNDYLALYARLIVVRNPQLDGLFQFKQMKSDRVYARE